MHFLNYFSTPISKLYLHRFPAELHIVHFNQKYDNFTEASKHSDGLAVLAVLIEVTRHKSTIYSKYLVVTYTFTNLRWKGGTTLRFDILNTSIK